MARTSYFAKKVYKAEMVQRLYSILEEEKKAAFMNYEVVGEEQAWDFNEHKPKVDENGEPVMHNKWDYVEKPLEEVTEEDVMKKEVLEELIEELEKLV